VGNTSRLISTGAALTLATGLLVAPIDTPATAATGDKIEHVGYFETVGAT
jgi:hypothetical protein